jgi:thiamine pyrophosphokinase
MSSHHIVRDDQEPALIIANGAECSCELLGQLLEWSPFVVVLDSAIERVMKFDLKIDVLLGDFDHSFDVEKYKELQFPLEIIHVPNQEKTDLEKALDFLISRNFPAVNVVWATGKRADHTFNNIATIAKYGHLIKIVMVDDYSKIYLLQKKFEKWFTKNSILSLVPIGEVTGITTHNLKYVLQNESLQIGGRSGTSNTVENDGIVKIVHQSGNLILMECQD